MRAVLLAVGAVAREREARLGEDGRERSDCSHPYGRVSLLDSLPHAPCHAPHEHGGALVADAQRLGPDLRRPRDLLLEPLELPLPFPAQLATVRLYDDQVLVLHPLDERPDLALPEPDKAPEPPSAYSAARSDGKD